MTIIQLVFTVITYTIASDAAMSFEQCGCRTIDIGQNRGESLAGGEF